MGVEGYTGWHGEGKTYNAVWDTYHRWIELVRKADEQKAPRPQMWSNAQLVGGRRFDTWDQLMALIEEAIVHRHRALVLIDEAGKFLPSRFWNKMDPRILTVLQERRKVGAGLDLIWTAPHIEHVDKLLRDVTQVVHACKRFGGSEYSHDEGKPPRLFRVGAFDPVQINKAKGKPRMTRWVPFSPAIAALYQTGVVDMGVPLDAKVGQRPDYYAESDRGPADERPIALTLRQEPAPKRRRRVRDNERP